MSINMLGSLQNSRRSSSEISLKVKVDRIIHRFVEWSYDSHDGPFFHLQSVDLIVFDNTKDTRMMVRLLTIDLIDKHCWKLIEGACYDMSRFLIRDGGEGVHPFIHIEITDNSTIAPSDHDLIPRHCFILNLVDDTNWWGLANNRNMIDVCGILRTYQLSSNYKCRGVYSMALTLELEDKRKRNLIRCVLQGGACERALALLETLNVTSGVFVVVQYAQCMRKIDRGVELSTVLGATRVFIDPDYPEVAMAKKTTFGE